MNGITLVEAVEWAVLPLITLDICHSLRSNACTRIYTSRFSMNDVTDMGRPVLVYIQLLYTSATVYISYCIHQLLYTSTAVYISYCIHQLLSERYLLHFMKLSG
jgi:hypothetical protein